MQNASTPVFGLAPIQMAGTSDRWDLWKSLDRVGTDNSWVGVVKQLPDGDFVGRAGNSTDFLGPFHTLDEASREIAARLAADA